MKSMTGFAATEGVIAGYRIGIEVKTLNHRYLEFKFKGPWEYSLFEPQILHQIKKIISRGFVEITVQQSRFSQTHSDPHVGDPHVGGNIRLNKRLLSQYVKHLFYLKKKFSLKDDLKLKHILSLPNIWEVSKPSLSSKENLKKLLQLVNSCLKKVNEMRSREGKNLEKIIIGYLGEVHDLLKEIEFYKTQWMASYEEKLKEKLDRFLEDKKLDPVRLHQEVAYLINRSDISEECVRLQSHIAQFGIFLKKNEGHRPEGLRPEPHGKSLDFLLQEMNREITTIGSKSQDSFLSQKVVMAKSLLEKMREQIQNVE